MRDVELYRALLGLTAPWTVAGADVDVKRQRVVVRVDAGPGPYLCPECAALGPGYDRKPAAGAISTRCSIRHGSSPTSRG